MGYRPCAQCGNLFKPQKRKGKFCSRKCFNESRPQRVDPREARKASSRARKLAKQKTWDGIPDREIFERAAWACQLGPWCKTPDRPISADAPWNTPLAPEIDHIIPLSYGGLDAEGNKRAAHRACNQSRNNRMTDGEKLFMREHPELLLAKARLALLPPRKKREPKPPKPPKPVRVCCCEGCDAVCQRRVCPDCAVTVNRHRAQQYYYLKRGLTPPDPWWAASGLTEHQAHS